VGAREKREEVKAPGDDRRKHFLFPSLFSVPKVCKTVRLLVRLFVSWLFRFIRNRLEHPCPKLKA
jgi:hypothetical protein